MPHSHIRKTPKVIQDTCKYLSQADMLTYLRATNTAVPNKRSLLWKRRALSTRSDNSTVELREMEVDWRISDLEFDPLALENSKRHTKWSTITPKVRHTSNKRTGHVNIYQVRLTALMSDVLNRLAGFKLCTTVSRGERIDCFQWKPRNPVYYTGNVVQTFSIPDVPKWLSVHFKIW